jgi:dinuclear metal center YbgI/SA1388 family protein
MAVARDDIIAFCDELLAAADFDDYGPNGLQVPGSAEVTAVVTGVSANLALFERAADAGGDLVLVHHGLFWEKQPLAVDASMKERLRFLFDRDISLAAYHLPLDAHRTIGNNALLCEGLGLEQQPVPFASAKGRSIGIVGRCEAIGVRDLLSRLGGLTGREPLWLEGGPDEVRSVGIVSGGGQFALQEAASLRLDAFITGEPAEWAAASARELGIHFIAGGHHATETFGIRRLGELVSDRFGLRHDFVDIANPV